MILLEKGIKKFRDAELSLIMVYFRLSQSMQVCVLRRGLKPKQKAGGLFFCNNNARNLLLSPRPSHAKHACARRSMPLLYARIEAAQEPCRAVNETLHRLRISPSP
ncbi:hypothetical protein [Shinella sp.]|uniref:hypothetical protein n=1 Tax=Shinella sp. TaxID=1870904 RepID=UPI00403591B5